MALTEEQTIIDSKIRSLGYHVKFDHQLRDMLADSTKRLDLYKEGKQGVEDKEESLYVEFEEMWEEHYEVDGDGKIINQPIEAEPRISETIPNDINGLSVSEVKALFKDLYYQQHLASWQDKIDIAEGNISLITSELDFRIQNIVERNPIGTTFYQSYDGNDSTGDPQDASIPWRTITPFLENARTKGDVLVTLSYTHLTQPTKLLV